MRLATEAGFSRSYVEPMVGAASRWWASS